jgi:outer membrane protein TolC
MTARITTRFLFTPLLVVCLLPAPSSSGGEGGGLSLAEAMATARERARDVAAAEAQWQASRERVREARGYRLPTVRLEEVWMRTDSPAEAFALTLNQERFSFQDFVAGDPNSPDPVESALTRLEVELPLYTGGELPNRIRQAELAAEAAGEQARGSADGAALAAAEAYLGLAMLRERVTLLERSLATLEEHVEQARAYVDQGMMVRSELLRAEVEQARLEDMLAAARGQVRVAQAGLAFRLAAAADSTWELAPVPPPPAAARELDAWLAAADRRPDLAAARRMARAAELEIEVQKAARLPKVGLLVRGDLVDDTPFGDHGDSTAVMARATLDLFAGGRHRAGIAAAEADAEAARQGIDHMAEAVRLAVRQAWVEADSARQRHATAESALDAAREAERITGERFNQGVVKTIDLLDATTALREAESRELVARADANLAVLRLAVAAGQPPESALPGNTTTETTGDDDMTTTSRDGNPL